MSRPGSGQHRVGRHRSAMTVWTAYRSQRETPPGRRTSPCSAGRSRCGTGGWYSPFRPRTTTRWRACRFRVIRRCCCGKTTSPFSKRTGATRRAIFRRSPKNSRSVLEAMVLLDDNPAERGLVRRLLPQVAVPELPDDPALYARTLAAAGYFEAVAFSDEDRGAPTSIPGQRAARQPAETGRRRRRLSCLAEYGNRLPAVRRHGPGAHRAADQQIEPVQSDHAPLHGSGGRVDPRPIPTVSLCRSASPIPSAITA